MFDAIREDLLQKKIDIETRLTKISAHTQLGLDKDSKERAIELENDEVMEELSIEGKHELNLINHALERIQAGTYGYCRECQEAIPVQRLKALPFAETCVDCA